MFRCVLFGWNIGKAFNVQECTEWKIFKIHVKTLQSKEQSASGKVNSAMLARIP
jgi:hypothetical protein